MNRQLLAAMVALCATRSLCAQAVDTAGGGALTIAVGRIQENRRDASDSPVAYAGAGLGGRVAYEWGRAGRRAYVALSGGEATLTPVTAISQPGVLPMQELFDVITLTGGVAWTRTPGGGRFGELSLGLELGASLTTVRHQYSGQDTPQQSFDLGVAGVGPTVRWRGRLGSGTASASLGVPLVSVVDHPYADVRYAPQVTGVRFASLSTLRQANGAVSYEFVAGARTGIVAEYRLGALALDDTNPVRRVSQLLSVGVVRRFGGQR